MKNEGLTPNAIFVFSIDDLATGNLLNFVPKMPMGRWANLPPLATALSAHTIIGITDAASAVYGGYDLKIIALWDLILTPCGVKRDMLFVAETDLNDRIVKQSSQQGGIGNGNQTIIDETDHFTVRNSDDTIKRIKILLDEPANSNLFTK